ncbi:MAG: hypothetical protein M1436_03380 [Acidobacteria bacterium]|nr:hypothetical protein [Acidobacteriota bacterium]
MKTLTWLVMLAMSSNFTETLTFDSATIGKLPSGWAATTARPGATPPWRIFKDPSAPTQPYVLAHIPPDRENPLAPVAILEKPSVKDGEVSVKFKAVGGKPEQDAGVVWRYLDENNYYFVRADAVEKNVAMFKVEDGKRIPLAPRGRRAYPVKHRVTPNAWGILKVAFKGHTFSVYYDHRRIFQVQDPTFSQPGKVGLWTRAESTAYFDNFRVVENR